MLGKILKILALIVLVCILILIAYNGYAIGYRYVVGQNMSYRELEKRMSSPEGKITESTPGAIQILIPRSADIDQITQILEKNKLISGATTFKLLSRFNGFNGRYQAGTHYLIPGMSYDEIMFTLTRMPSATNLSFPEGMTYTQIKRKLKDAGLNFDEKRLDELINQPGAFLDYSFVRDLKANPERKYTLQGYLWPDTYQFDPNQDEESILRMFFDNTERKLSESAYPDRAAGMNMTIDQVLSLASIVQKEGRIEEMSKIARVFINRLKIDMPLASDASINYLREEAGENSVLWVPKNDLSRFHGNPYDSYSRKGLPPGPINNPGIVAIEAVLWPATEATWPGANSYLYFCAKGDGTNVFSKTQEEHDANVAKYSALKP